MQRRRSVTLHAEHTGVQTPQERSWRSAAHCKMSLSAACPCSLCAAAAAMCSSGSEPGLGCGAGPGIAQSRGSLLLGSTAERRQGGTAPSGAGRPTRPRTWPTAKSITCGPMSRETRPPVCVVRGRSDAMAADSAPTAGKEARRTTDISLWIAGGVLSARRCLLRAASIARAVIRPAVDEQQADLWSVARTRHGWRQRASKLWG